MAVRAPSILFLQYVTNVFDNIGDGIFLVGIEPGSKYRLLLANDAFAQANGHGRQSYVGGDIADAVSPQMYAFLEKHYEKVIAARAPLDCKAWLEVAAGLHAFEIRFIPILNTVGDCVQIAAVTRNVTEVHKLRRELRRLKAMKS